MSNISTHKLVVAEKPSVAISIAKILGANNRKDGYTEGNGYIVSWCVGHLVGLAEPEAYSEKYSVPPWQTDLSSLPIIPETWKFTVNKETRKQFEVLKKLMNSADVEEIINACDSGREGECIFRYVYFAANCRKRFSRLWIASLEDKAIQEGFRNLRPGSDFDNLYASGLCRAKADFLVGINGTRLYSTVYNSFLSVGRVQTPTLSMIAERDYKVKNFVKEKYFTVKLNTGTFTAQSGRIYEQSQAEIVKNDCHGKTATVTMVTRNQKTERPPRLHDLTTLQREANRIFGYTAQETLNATQKLYERKYVTYPRTDSRYITGDMADSTRYLVERIGCKYCKVDYRQNCDVSQIVKNSAVSDHHAILPTMEVIRVDSSELSECENNILFLIITKLLCAIEKPYVYETITAEIECSGYKFTVKGRSNISLGWKQIEAVTKALNGVVDKNDDNKPLIVSEGQKFTYPICSITESWTSPPKHYTEDTLLSAMETAGQRDVASDTDFVGEENLVKCGIGTPATRAGTIETLIKRGYIVRDKKNILATEKGINLISIVPDSIKSAKLTAEWETELQKIERGEIGADSFMSSITAFTKTLVAVNSSAAQGQENMFSAKRDVTVIGKCPKCAESLCGGGDVTENSKAYSCNNRCGFAIWKKPFFYTKTLTETQARQLLQNRRTGHYAGFKSKAGKEFSAYFILKDDNTLWYSF